jgi:uncharacterized membrane protein
MLVLKIIIVTLLLDIIFLWFISKRISEIIYSIQGSRLNVNIFYAIIVYVFICIQLYYFVFMNNASLQYAFLLGSSTYGIYEFTNMALLNKWDYKMALLDTLWGGILYSLSTFIIRNI